MPILHAFDAIATPPTDFPAVTVVAGNDAGLRSWVIGILTGDADVTNIDGETARWNDLRDDLETASLFSCGEKRTVLVRSGDKLVKDARSELEQFAAAPSDASRLVLEVDSLPSNTRLFKVVAQDHLVIQCAVPQISAGRATRPDIAKLRAFITGVLVPRHQAKMTGGAADTLVELIGDNIAMLDTEVAKLAVHLAIGATINEALVRDVVAGWRGKTIWDTTDAALAGNAAEALRHLDKLIGGGERALALLPQLAWSVRRLGMGIAMVEEKEANGARCSPRDGLTASGFKGRPQDLGNAESQMKQLGRKRVQQLLPWLLEADLKLKGSHSAEDRERWVLENLVFKLAAKNPAAQR